MATLKLNTMRNAIMEVNNNSLNGFSKVSKDIIHPDVYQITHDLRSPLNSIQGLINLMKSDSTKEHLDEYITFMESSVKKMDRSISAIIDFAKEDKKSEVLTQEIDFKKLIDESLLSLRYMENAQFVHFTVDVKESGLFLSDYGRLLSIFNNMISNAIRYRDPAKKSFLNIIVSFMSGGAIIFLEDNGVGIEKAYQHKIFNKLFRVSQDNRGSGLGLHIVRNCIKKLKGEIKVSSTLGVGTTFTIEIPNLLSKGMSINCD